MDVSFSHLWGQEDFSDIDVVLTVGAQEVPADHAGNSRNLHSFPAHSALMSRSPFFTAQLLRWQNNGDNAGGNGRPQLVLTLDSPDQQPAAMAAFEALYATKPLPELLSGLPQEQQLQVALLAEFWELPGISAAAAAQLVEVLNTAGQLSDSVTQQLMTAQALPACLEPLLKTVLPSVFGDLEAVWADEALWQQLLGLPLDAFKLLLSCDELKVASEDTVLYTAGRYADIFDDAEQRRLVQQQLAPLVRCMHLSMLWLTSSLSSGIAADMVLASVRPVLSLILMHRVGSTPESGIPHGPIATPINDLLDRGRMLDAPRRPVSAVDGVSLVWKVPVSQIKQAAQECATTQTRTVVPSACVSPPLGGVAFGMDLVFCSDHKSPAGVVIKVRAKVSDSFPDDAYVGFKAGIEVGGKSYACVVPSTLKLIHKAGAVMPNKDTTGGSICYLPPMAGGWDEMAWATAGLPASGELAITMTVSQVSHMPFNPRAAQPAAQLAPDRRAQIAAQVAALLAARAARPPAQQLDPALAAQIAARQAARRAQMLRAQQLALVAADQAADRAAQRAAQRAAALAEEREPRRRRRQE